MTNLHCGDILADGRREMLRHTELSNSGTGPFTSSGWLRALFPFEI
jgi:hypothetical protein